MPFILANELDALPSLIQLVRAFLNEATLQSLKERSICPLGALFDLDYEKFLENHAIPQEYEPWQFDPARLLWTSDCICKVIREATSICPNLLEMRDTKGRTILHKATRAFCQRQELFNVFHSILPMIITQQNVNAMDNEGVTPYGQMVMYAKRYNCWMASMPESFKVKKIFEEHGAHEEHVQTSVAALE